MGEEALVASIKETFFLMKALLYECAIYRRPPIYCKARRDSATL